MKTHITGRTLLAGIVGWPVEHSLSPAMHNAAYEALGLDWVYVPLPVSDETDLLRVIGAVRVLPFVGLNVTMPYKQVMLDMCDEVATLARVAGAVNTVHCDDGRLIGYNTDGRGLVDSLAEEVEFDPQGAQIVLLGAGGAASAALLSLILGKAARITVLNRSADRAEELVERVSTHACETVLEAGPFPESASEVIRSADLVINATPVGMKREDSSPIPQEWLRSGQVVADMVYGAKPTPLVVAARAAGATAVDGLGMLVSQGAIALETWSRGAQTPAPREVMRRAAKDSLAEAASRKVEEEE